MAATYYVSPSGSDAYAGTSNAPFATPLHAVTLSSLAPGDTIFVRGGTYACSAQVKPSKAGTAGNLIKIWAYPGETPIFDFTGLNDRGFYFSKSYWHAKGIEVRNAGQNGICLSSCSNNIIEGCVAQDNGLEGIKLTGSANHNLILNCDSYRNYDASTHGENADGFAAKSGVGIGNVFMGCRSWNNADDGWDFYDCPSTITLSNCWAFSNGINLWNDTSWQGDGNGFKLGGASTTNQHVLYNCLAFDNPHNGFDQNHTKGGQTMYNCTGFRNNVNYSFYETPTYGVHVLKNNISYSGPVNLDGTAVQVSNSWQGFTVTAADFVSLDASLALAARNADYSLPTNGFARLAAGSQLIDKGVDVGLPYNGSAPDLGAYEFSATPQGPISFSTSSSNLQMTNGSFAMQLNGLTAHGSVIFYASTDLTNWQAIYTNPPVTGALQFVDASATNWPVRYYRAEEK